MIAHQRRSNSSTRIRTWSRYSKRSWRTSLLAVRLQQPGSGRIGVHSVECLKDVPYQDGIYGSFWSRERYQCCISVICGLLTKNPFEGFACPLPAHNFARHTANPLVLSNIPHFQDRLHQLDPERLFEDVCIEIRVYPDVESDECRYIELQALQGDSPDGRVCARKSWRVRCNCRHDSDGSLTSRRCSRKPKDAAPNNES